MSFELGAQMQPTNELSGNQKADAEIVAFRLYCRCRVQRIPREHDVFLDDAYFTHGGRAYVNTGLERRCMAVALHEVSTSARQSGVDEEEAV